MFQRPYFKKFKSRIEDKRRFIQVLMGPRQVGKTTLVRQILMKYSYPWHYASADEATQSAWLKQQWETIRVKIRAEGSKEGLLVIDEIQKIPDWSNQVKVEWDKDSFDETPIKLVLLGSSQLLLQKGLSESLAGRFEVHYLPHWSFSEMNDAFGMSFDDFLWFGGYPGPVELIQDELRWKEYILHSLIETTLMRDILLMTRIDKPALLRNLFDLACSYSGQILSFSKILGQLNDAGNTTTLSNYLKLLEGAGMAKGLEKFSPEKIRQRASIPKFQVFNQGLMSASVQYLKGDVKKDKKLWGRWFESVVGAHLLNLSYNSGFSLFYWRDGNDEVDFVLRKGDKIVALEIKSGRIKSSHGMHSFNTRYPITRTMIVGPGGIPAEDFLRINPEDFF